MGIYVFSDRAHVDGGRSPPATGPIGEFVLGRPSLPSWCVWVWIAASCSNLSPRGISVWGAREGRCEHRPPASSELGHPTGPPPYPVPRIGLGWGGGCRVLRPVGLSRPRGAREAFGPEPEPPARSTARVPPSSARPRACGRDWHRFDSSLKADEFEPGPWGGIVAQPLSR